MQPAQSTEFHAQALDEVRHEISSLRAKLSQLEQVERYHADKAGVRVGVVRLEQAPLQPVRVAKVDGTGWQHDLDFLLGGDTRVRDNLIFKLVDSAERPLSAGEIARRMIAQGFKHPQGESHLRNAVFMLCTRKSDQFEKVKDGPTTFWKVKKEPSILDNI